jgi:phosphatidylinositol 3-kinase
MPNFNLALHTNLVPSLSSSPPTASTTFSDQSTDISSPVTPTLSKSMSMASIMSETSNGTTVSPMVAQTPRTAKDRQEFRVEIRSAEDHYIDDGETGQINLVEEKHLKQSMTGYVDPDLKPNAEETRRIQTILDYPPLHEVSLDDKKILWKFRYYLRSNRRALTKFLRCVDWSFIKESQEADKLIEQWNEIGTVDALLLLSRFFRHIRVVRDYAVSVLKKADDEEILDVLLQLVQALRYEIPESEDSMGSVSLTSSVSNSDLANFLMTRACRNFAIANNLYWYLSVESQDVKYGNVFGDLHHKFRMHLRKNGAEEYLERLLRQQRLVDSLVELGRSLKVDKDPRPKKIKTLRKILSSKGPPWDWHDIFCNNISSKFEPSPLTLPLSPTTEVTGIFAEESNIFKSAMSPMLVPFREVDNNNKFSVIFKCGDDLRQDQLIIQLITLMDKLLKKNGLDTKLTPYRVLACGQDFGFVQAVTPNAALSSIIAKGDIKGWLKQHNPREEDYRTALQNFVKSCAGYCVVTYILGIGDRHLDNVLLKPNGDLFHIDFGFILGRDPKPFAPPMKLCKEMVEGMGGSKSEGYLKFKDLCCTAYNILRKNAHLILNMFVLMVDANIKDITGLNQQGGSASDNAMNLPDPLKNLMKVQEKFRLDLSDTQAMIFMQSIINESEKALFPQITETIHRWAQYWRS